MPRMADLLLSLIFIFFGGFTLVVLPVSPCMHVGFHIIFLTLPTFGNLDFLHYISPYHWSGKLFKMTCCISYLVQHLTAVLWTIYLLSMPPFSRTLRERSKIISSRHRGGRGQQKDDIGLCGGREGFCKR